jgi:tetratricopeptide (TPR) repeat protein
MGKQSREKRFVRHRPAELTDGAGVVSTRRAAAPIRFRPSGWKRAVARLGCVLLVPIALLGFTEAALRLGGYGHSTRFFEPREDGLILATNPRFAWQFHSRETSTAPTPLVFPAHKQPGVFRIFVLGESAAAGTPDPAFSFSRMLELMLRQQYPNNRFEVINAAMRGINSHIVRLIARECAELSPDLFIVYMGNNEFIGLHSPSPEEFNFTPYLRLLRLGHAIKATRLAQLTQSLLRRFLPKPERRMQEMDYLRRQRLAFDDPRRRAVYDNFQANLADICEAARRSGATTILATVGVNLRDFPPLASLHRPGLTPAQLAEWEKAYSQGAAAESRKDLDQALKHFEAAARLDDHFAELHFRIARGYAAAGKTERARQNYTLARDWDALQFRADSRLNDIVRQTAANFGRKRGEARGAKSDAPLPSSPSPRTSRVLLADAALFMADFGLPIADLPGPRTLSAITPALFHEHVHFTFDGDYQLARFLLPTVTAALGLGSSDGKGERGEVRGTTSGSALPSSLSPLPSLPAPSRDDCARALAFTPVDEMNVLAAMAQQTSKPPFLDQLEHAQRQAEADQRVRERLGRMTMNDFENAAAVYREALARAPDDWMLHYNFGNLFSQFGRPGDAAAEYEFVVKRLPRQRVFRLNFGNALAQSGRPTEALAQYRAALEIDPDFAPAKAAIASLPR